MGPSVPSPAHALGMPSALATPPVTVITPVYNGADYIVETVESVLAQNYPGLEYIVLDDGSTDDTLALLERYRERLTLVSHPNMGEPATVNKGVAMAGNDIVAIVNADDPVMPGLIAKAAGMLSARPELVGVYPDWRKIDACGRTIEEVTTLEFDYALMIQQHFCIPGPGAFFRKSRLEGEPVRADELRYSSDFDLWLRLGLRGPMARIPEILATWRTHQAGASTASRNPEMAHNKVEVIERLFARGDLPPAIRVLRRQAQSAANYAAGLLAIHNRDIPGRRYMIRSLLAKPLWPGDFLPTQRRSWLRVAYVMGGPFAKALHLLARREAPESDIDEICFFLPDLSGGGAERVFVGLANALAAKGRRIGFTCGTGKGPLRAELREEVRVTELGARRVMRSILPLWAMLRKRQPKVIFSAMTHANIALLIATRILPGYRGRVFVQEVARLPVGRHGGRPWVQRLSLKLVRRLYRYADCVVAVSEVVAADLRNNQRGTLGNLRVMANPVDLPSIEAAARESVDHRWLKAGAAPVVLAVGRLSPEKDFATLLQAIALARMKRDIRLIVLGEGAERASLESLARTLGVADVVDFLGFTPNPWAFMVRADLLAVSSVSEGFGLVLVEAMACGCNVVTTRCGSAPEEIVEGGQLGGIAPVGNPEALAAAICEALDTPISAERLRRKAAAYDISVIRDKYARLLLGNG